MAKPATLKSVKSVKAVKPATVIDTVTFTPEQVAAPMIATHLVLNETAALAVLHDNHAAIVNTNNGLYFIRMTGEAPVVWVRDTDGTETVVCTLGKPAEVIVTAKPVRVVTVDPVREYLKGIRQQRVMQVARASETIVDAIDSVTAVSRAIRAGVDDAATEGRADAAASMRSACDLASKAGAPASKVCALKWANLARLASAKRK